MLFNFFLFSDSKIYLTIAKKIIQKYKIEWEKK